MSNDLLYQRGQECAHEISEQIDRQIIWDLIRESHPDWTLVQIPVRSSEMGSEICQWAQQQFESPVCRCFCCVMGTTVEFLFRDQQDAVFTKLRWL